MVAFESISRVVRYRFRSLLDFTFRRRRGIRTWNDELKKFRYSSASCTPSFFWNKIRNCLNTNEERASFRLKDFPWIEARKARVARNERALHEVEARIRNRGVAARIMIDGSFRAKICRSRWNYRTSSAYSSDQRYRHGGSCALRSYTKRHA